MLSKRAARGNLYLQVSPLSLMTEFLVLDIKATFNLLLGRPWFHQALATYHQFLKFRYKGSIVTIHQADNEVRLSAEEETVSYLPSLEEDMLSIEKEGDHREGYEAGNANFSRSETRECEA